MVIFKKPTYRWKYWWKNLNGFRRDIYYAWQRANNGYCDQDTWDISQWFLNTIPQILTRFKDNLHSYHPDFTYEEWVAIIERMIYCFKEGNEETCSLTNQYLGTFPLGFNFEEDKDNPNFHRLIELPMTEEEKNNKRLWLEETLNISDYQEKMKKEGLELFIKYFNHLWD